MATSTQQWSTDLNARSAPRVTYAYLGPDDGTWEGVGAGLEARDLGAAEALDERVGARDVRATDGATLDWRAHTGDFLALYLRSGSASITTADGETHELGADDAIYLPPLHRFRAELTPGTVMIEITAPAAIEYLEGDAAPESSDKAPIVNHDAPDKYVSDGGPLSRTFFSYRDLGVTEATEGRIMLEVLRAVEPADRTGWHTHSMGQIALILSGKAMIQVEEHPPVALVANSTCYIGNRMRHDVYDVDDDYALLEVYMPADWDTIPCPAPKNAAPR